MLIRPWDAALNDDEWRAWLAAVDRFGLLAVNNVDPARAPLSIPTPFTLSGDELLFHLASANPVWPHLEAAVEVRLAVVGDNAFIPSSWRAKAGGPDEDDVPTTYYTAVQFVGPTAIIDDPAGKIEILAAQFADLQPEADHPIVSVDTGPYARMLPAIRGVRLKVERVEAKFKYDDANPVEHRARVADLLDRRGRGQDLGAARQQRRRLAVIGQWSEVAADESRET